MTLVLRDGRGIRVAVKTGCHQKMPEIIPGTRLGIVQKRTSEGSHLPRRTDGGNRVIPFFFFYCIELKILSALSRMVFTYSKL